MTTSEQGRGLRIALDLIFLALALVFFLALGLPDLSAGHGYRRLDVASACCATSSARAKKAKDPREMVGYTAGSMIARGWICALIIFGVGIATEDEVGSSAAVLFVLTFTFYLSVSMIRGRSSRSPSDGGGNRQPGPRPARARATTTAAAWRPSGSSSSA